MLPFMPPSARSVLEIGCSTGAFAAQLRERYPDCDMIGLEPSAERADVARMTFDRVVTGTFPELKDDIVRPSGYDLILCNDVLEHIADPAAALCSLRDMLSDRGQLVASIPNVRHLSALGPLLLAGEWEYKESGVLDATHLRFFTERSIRRLFDEGGWEITRMEGINRIFLMRDEKPRWWVKAAAACTKGRSDAFFFVQYAVVAKPAAAGAAT